MTITSSGQITAGNIGSEFGRTYSSYMSMWNARNGRYGAINSQSARYPTNGISKTNSGYAFSDWYGYRHNARNAAINLFQTESRADADTRAWEFRYNGTALGQSWQWGTTSIRGWLQIPFGNRIDVYFDNSISWGSSWTTAFRAIYSNQRGWLLYVNEAARTYRNYTNLFVQSSENISIYNRS
jgi:hypothetical protein